LYLLIDPPKTLGWRYKYRIGGREKLLSFGVYPDVPTALARERRDEARKQLATGRDPSVIRKAMEHAQANTFASVAQELLVAQTAKLEPGLAPLRRKRRGLKSACTLTSGVNRLPM